MAATDSLGRKVTGGKDFLGRSVASQESPPDKPAKKEESPSAPEEPAPVPAPEPAPQEAAEPESGPPKEYEAKQVWVDYAATKGADRDELEQLTKKEIIELYGEPEGQ